MNLNSMVTREDLTKEYISKLAEQFKNPSSNSQRERARDKLAEARRIASGDPDAMQIHLWILQEGIDLKDVAFAKPEDREKHTYS